MARVVLTQPQPRIAGIGRAIRARGFYVLELPLTRLEPEPPSDLSERVASADWVIAVSPAALAFLLDALEDRWPGQAGLAVVGPGSLVSLQSRRLSAAPSSVVFPEIPPWDAASLIATRPFVAPEGLRCLVIRGDGGRESWIECLRDQGAHVEVLAIYRRRIVEPAAEVIEALRAWVADVEPIDWVFTQTATIATCRKLLGERFGSQRSGRDRALVVHSRIADEARAAGFDRVAVVEPGVEALAAALESA